MHFSPFKYSDQVPPEYVCGACSADGVRLYRDYQTVLDHQRLVCTSCAERAEGRTVDPSHPHSIGWKVAAVPTEDGTTFWGYTSVPMAGVRWWDALPLTKGILP